jgi:hypothetical protein
LVNAVIGEWFQCNNYHRIGSGWLNALTLRRLVLLLLEGMKSESL